MTLIKKRYYTFVLEFGNHSEHFHQLAILDWISDWKFCVLLLSSIPVDFSSSFSLQTTNGSKGRNLQFFPKPILTTGCIFLRITPPTHPAGGRGGGVNDLWRSGGKNRIFLLFSQNFLFPLKTIYFLQFSEFLEKKEKDFQRKGGWFFRKIYTPV